MHDDLSRIQPTIKDHTFFFIVNTICDVLIGSSAWVIGSAAPSMRHEQAQGMATQGTAIQLFGGLVCCSARLSHTCTFSSTNDNQFAGCMPWDFAGLLTSFLFFLSFSLSLSSLLHSTDPLWQILDTLPSQGYSSFKSSATKF